MSSTQIANHTNNFNLKIVEHANNDRHQSTSSHPMSHDHARISHKSGVFQHINVSSMLKKSVFFHHHP